MVVVVDGAAPAVAAAPAASAASVTSKKPNKPIAAAAPTSSASAPPLALTGPTLAQLAQTFTVMSPSQARPDLKLAVTGAQVGSGGKTVEVAVSCTPAAPATRLTLAQARAALFSGGPKLIELRDKLKTAKLLDDGLSQIVFVPAVLNCIAAQ